jgi:hypothetical protein
MRHIASLRLVALALLITIPSVAEAGPPLICHPFQTERAALLPWGSGPGWNTPASSYRVHRLTADTIALLDREAPILARMENIRRAVIYAAQNRRVAEQLLAEVMARANLAGADRLAVFDAGYLVETFKQATHLYGRAVTADDGYRMVQRAIEMGPPVPEMEFAAALMTTGAISTAHVQRARAAAPSTELRKNIATLGW